jgi:predicted phage tail protein
MVGNRLKLQKRIDINPEGSLQIEKKVSISDKKAELFARIARINEEPLTPYEKRTILAQFSSGNEMQLSTEEKATILEALNRYNR